MNEKILSAEEMFILFDVFTEDMLTDVIDFEAYCSVFREKTRAEKNSRFEFMYKGFIGGMYITVLADEKYKDEV